MSDTPQPLPVANRESGLVILRELLRDRSLLTALSLMRRHVGRAFRITMPRFQPAVFVGPESNRQVLVTDRQLLSWRNESDPVVKLLRRGLLVVDGVEHDDLRRVMDPPYHRRNVLPHADAMWRYTDLVTADWRDGEVRDMLVEMRRLALLVLMGTSFKVEIAPDLDRLIPAILHLLEYISPGFWILWPGMPVRAKYRKAAQEIDEYLYAIIAQRRRELAASGAGPDPGDLLGNLVASGLDDNRIRDQLLTMLIAGHDTSTALQAWMLYVLGMHPATMAQLHAEVDAVLGPTGGPPDPTQLNQLHLLEQVMKETLRLYPPIHVGNRRATQDLCIAGYQVPQNTRMMYSSYLSHRDPGYWSDPDGFCPARFEHGDEKVPPFTYVPFGGGPRNCIGAAFAQVEAKVVMARLFQTFQFELLNGGEIKPHMGATLEPRPGVKMRVRRRNHGAA
jgi:cytochrome P450